MYTANTLVSKSCHKVTQGTRGPVGIVIGEDKVRSVHPSNAVALLLAVIWPRDRAQRNSRILYGGQSLLDSMKLAIDGENDKSGRLQESHDRTLKVYRGSLPKVQEIIVTSSWELGTD